LLLVLLLLSNTNYNSKTEKKATDDDSEAVGEGEDEDEVLTDPEDEEAIQRVLEDMASLELKVGMVVQALWSRDNKWYKATISTINQTKAVPTAADTVASSSSSSSGSGSGKRTPTKGNSPSLSPAKTSSEAAATVPSSSLTDETSSSPSSTSNERPKSGGGRGKSPVANRRVTAAAKKKDAAAKKRSQKASKKVEWVTNYFVKFDGYDGDDDEEIQVARHHIRIPTDGSLDATDAPKLLSAPVRIEDRVPKKESKSSSSSDAKKAEPQLSPRSRARIVEEQQRERDIAKGRIAPDCPMCDREMPLTAHHLTPRTTHAKYLAQGVPQSFLNITVDVCRPCHSALHKLIDEPTLAAEFNTLEKLMADERIQKWVNYARKQRARPKEFGHDAKNFKYRR
jgi:hypothetical protein